tara:strand:- start:21 stop:2234 length:2214 start_codon:yes stop_codon:yes gene_type:complete
MANGDNSNLTPEQFAEQLQRMQQTNEQRRERLKLEKELADVLNLKTKSQELNIKLLQEEKEDLEDIIKLKLQEEEASKRFYQLDELITAQKKAGSKEDASLISNLAETMELLENIAQHKDKSIDQLKEEIKQKEKNIEVEKLWLKAYEKKDQAIKGIFDLGKKVMSMTYETTMLYDQQRGALSAVATQGMNYAKSMSVVMNASTAAGLSFQEASEGLIQLAKSFNDVALLTISETKNLALLTAGMQKFGIDATGTFNTATLAMGMSANEAGDLALQLFAVGDALGPRMRATINKDFGPAMSTLAAYTNKRAIAVFQKLAAQAQATGMQIGELLGVAAQFDTYEGAAEAVGRLNSMLGGDYLNSIQMLRATEAERIDLMRQSISMSGRNFSDLDRFQKKAVAASVGITDLAKAFQVFGTEQEKLDALSDKAEKAGMTLEQFQARMKAVNTVMQRFKVIGQALATVFGPVIDIIHLFVRGLEYIVTNVLGETGVKVVLLSVLAILSYFAIKAGMVAKAISLVVAALTTLIGLFVNLNDTLTKPHSPILFIMLGVILPAAFLLLAGVVTVAAMAIGAFGVAASQMGKGLQDLGAGLVSLQGAIASMGFLGFTGLLFDLGRLALVGVGMGPAAMGIMALASAIHSLATAFQALSNVDQEIIANSAKIFEKMAQITPINAVSTSAILDDFKNTMVTIRNEAIRTEDIKRKFEITVTHNNVRATNESIQGLGKQMAKQFDTFS